MEMKNIKIPDNMQATVDEQIVTELNILYEITDEQPIDIVTLSKAF